MADMIAETGEIPQASTSDTVMLAEEKQDDIGEKAPTTGRSLKARFCDKFRLKKGKAKSCMDVTDVDEVTVTGASPPGDVGFIAGTEQPLATSVSEINAAFDKEDEASDVSADGKAEGEQVPPPDSVEGYNPEETAPKPRMRKIKNAFRKLKRKNKRTEYEKEAAADEIKDVAEIEKDDEEGKPKDDMIVDSETTLLEEAVVTEESEDMPKVHVADAAKAEVSTDEEKGDDEFKVEKADVEAPQVEEVKIEEEDDDKEKGHEVDVDEKPGRLARFKKWLAKRGRGIRRAFTSCIPTRQD